MAERIEAPDIWTRAPYGSFIERYPQFPEWLDGNAWKIDIEAEIVGDLNTFRSTMHYQADAMNLKLRTKTFTEDGRKYLLIQAYEA